MSALLYINNLQRSIYTVVGMAPVDSWFWVPWSQYILQAQAAQFLESSDGISF